MQDFLTLAKDRYSVRRLSDKIIPQEMLEKILEAGRCAPTAHNNQPVKIWLIQSAEALEKVRSTADFPFLKAAPAVFAIGSEPAAAWVRPYDGKNFADIDAAIVATQMMLQIHDLGLGTTWVGHFDADKLKALFPEMIPFNMIALFPVGYPADEARPSRLHEDRKPEEETVRRL
jgi:nitroreductase